MQNSEVENVLFMRIPHKDPNCLESVGLCHPQVEYVEILKGSRVERNEEDDREVPGYSDRITTHS